MRRLLNFIIAALAAAFSFAAFYALAVFILGRLPAGAETAEAERGITVYIISNGVHTDIAMPLNHPAFDWSPYAGQAHTLSSSRDAQYIAVGWGDRDFYLNTPEWADLTLPAALSAAAGLNQTALHVSFHNELNENPDTAAIRISEAQYRRLARNIAATFQVQQGKSLPIAGAHYHEHDAFYEAHGRYTLFNTCNSWTNRQLKQAGIGGVYWTPLAQDVLNAAKRTQ